MKITKQIKKLGKQMKKAATHKRISKRSRNSTPPEKYPRSPKYIA